MLHTGEKECGTKHFYTISSKNCRGSVSSYRHSGTTSQAVYQSRLNDTNYKSWEKKLRPQDPPRFRFHAWQQLHASKHTRFQPHWYGCLWTSSSSGVLRSSVRAASKHRDLVHGCHIWSREPSLTSTFHHQFIHQKWEPYETNTPHVLCRSFQARDRLIFFRFWRQLPTCFQTRSNYSRLLWILKLLCGGPHRNASPVILSNTICDI